MLQFIQHFYRRAIDQIVHDVALQHLDVVFILDRAGLVGADGPTHHGSFDLSYLRFIPDIVIMAPKDEAELRNMLYTATEYKGGPVALRYPRGSALGVEVKEGFELIEIGKSEKLNDGEDVAILAVGSMVEYSKKVVDNLKETGISPALFNMRFIKPLDTKELDNIANKYDKIITIEENALVGGFGSGILEYFNDNNYKNEILRIGLPDKFIDHGTQAELHNILEIDPEGITSKITKFVSTSKNEKRGCNLKENTKIAVIGLGGVAQLVRLPILSKINSAEIVAVSELSKTRLNTVADKFHIKERFTNFKEMIEKVDFDAAIISTPTNTHKDIAVECLNNKKHVLIEKPIALNFEEAKEIDDAAKKNKCHAMVGMNFRFRPDTMLSKKFNK